MERENFLSGELDIAGMKAQYDEHVKRILGSRQVLARILQGTAEDTGNIPRSRSWSGSNRISGLARSRSVRAVEKGRTS